MNLTGYIASDGAPAPSCNGFKIADTRTVSREERFLSTPRSARVGLFLRVVPF
jgi:hypothetical protein